MKTSKHYLMDDVFDYLMENHSTIGTNIKEEFTDSWIDCENGVIHLSGSKTLPSFKITIQEEITA